MKFTKHFYIEGQRIVSKLGDMGKNQDLLNPKDTARAGNNGNHPIDWDNKHESLKDQLIENFEELGLTGAVFTARKSGKVPYGQIKKYYRNTDGIINDAYGNDTTVNNGNSGNKAELLQFYYHPDHLGSSNYITNVSGEVYQHVEYFPFGETFIEERTGTEYTTYLYNGKEFDEEIGLYYYGARYYDPRISMWYGVDPMAEKYYSWSPYNYVRGNPIKRIDPNGMWDDDITVNSKGIITNVVETDEPNKFYDEDGNQLFLNDAKNADKYIATKEDFKEGDRLYYPLSKSDVHSAIDDAGETSTWLGTAWESYTDADFTYSFLAPIVAEDKGISINEDYVEKGIFLPDDFGYFRVEGEKSIYNLYDAGNFTWGGWMKMNDYSLDKTLRAADWNSKLTGNGSDTKEDQRAIKNGYNFYLRNYGKDDK